MEKMIKKLESLEQQLALLNLDRTQVVTLEMEELNKNMVDLSYSLARVEELLEANNDLMLQVAASQICRLPGSV